MITPETMITVNFGLMITLVGVIWKIATLATELRLNQQFQGKQIDSAFQKIRDMEAKK